MPALLKHANFIYTNMVQINEKYTV